MVPVKPFRGAIVIVESAEAPAVAVTLVGLAETEKSETWKKIDVVVRVTDPTEPVTVTV